MVFLILLLVIITANLIISVFLLHAFSEKEKQEVIEDQEMEALKEQMEQMKNLMLYGLGGDEDD